MPVENICGCSQQRDRLYMLQQRQHQRLHIKCHLIRICLVTMVLFGRSGIRNGTHNTEEETTFGVLMVIASSSPSCYSSRMKRMNNVVRNPLLSSSLNNKNRNEIKKENAILFSLRCGDLSEKEEFEEEDGVDTNEEENNDAELDAYVESLIRDVELSNDGDDEEEEEQEDEESDGGDEESNILEMDSVEEEKDDVEDNESMIIPAVEVKKQKKRRKRSSGNAGSTSGIKNKRNTRKRRSSAMDGDINSDNDSHEEDKENEMQQGNVDNENKESISSTIPNLVHSDGDEKKSDGNKSEENENIDVISTTERGQEDEEQSQPFEESGDNVDPTLPKKHKKKRKKKPSSSAPTSSLPSPPVSTQPTPQQKQQPPPLPPPNGLYRFLLRKGPIGHYIIAISTIITQLLQTYLPELYHTMRLLLSKLGIYDRQKAYQQFLSSQKSYSKPSSPHVGGQPRGKTNVNEKYTAFVSSDGMTSGSKKASTKQKKQMDEIALWKLKRVGDVRMVKYRHLSLDFMKRHGLGPYNIEKEKGKVSAIAKDVLTEVDASSSSATSTEKASTAEEDEEESDIAENEDDDWVVQALMGDNDDEIAAGGDSDAMLEEGTGDEEESNSLSSILSGFSSNLGADISGSESFRGNGNKSKRSTRKRKKRTLSSQASRSAVLEAAAASRQSTMRSTSKKKTSSSSSSKGGVGGGGVLGRIRNVASTSNLVSSSTRILGAYPGDAAPRDEAGSADGVIALARKYGYGDWSDSDEEDEGEDNDDYSRVSSRRVRRTRKKKRSAPRDVSRQGRTAVSSSRRTRNDGEDLSSFSTGFEALHSGMFDDNSDET